MKHEQPNAMETNEKSISGAGLWLLFGLLVSCCFAPFISPIATLCAGLLFLTVGNYILCPDVLNPAFVFSAVWATAALTFLLYPGEIAPLSWDASLILLSGALCFSAGVLLGSRPLVIHSSAWFSGRPSSNLPRRLFLAYSCIMLPVFTLDTVRIAGGFSLSPMFLIVARDAIIAARRDNTIAYSSHLVSTAIMVSVLTAWLILGQETSKTLKVAAVGIVFIMCLLSTGRTGLMQFLSGWFVLVLLRKRDRRLARLAKPLIAIGASVLLLMALITLLTKKETQTSNTVQVALTLTAEYIAGPIAAFDIGIHNLAASGYLDDFIFVPFPTNVYTAYRIYYLALGPFCSLPFLMIGAIYGYVFRSAARGNNIAVFLMVYAFYALVMSPFTDAFSLVVRHFQVLGYAAFYFVACRRVPTVRFWRRPAQQLQIQAS